MLRAAGYNIVFQEVPDEVTLAINLSNCPHRCRGCHSPHLRDDVGEALDENLLCGLMEKYGQAITCVCFMGGDATPQEVEACSVFVRKLTDGRVKTGWYSGRGSFPAECSCRNFDYVKLGAYVENMGGLDSEKTNQRFYRICDGEMIDETRRFWKKKGGQKVL